MNQKDKKAALKPMIDALQGMMQKMGVPKIEFADDNGKVHGRIVAPKAKDVPCVVPAYGGGTVTIRQGDHIRLWYRDEDKGTWGIEGNAHQREAKGIVIFIGPEWNLPGVFDLAYQRDDSEKTEGATSCCLSCPPAGWARVVEKLEKAGKKS